ncbi:MAG TPA: hypothetical protein VN455_03145, partial [Methanotrichaceae archaeon]|nr:hypothetical protein [Methanotrichaceae archaeon]
MKHMTSVVFAVLSLVVSPLLLFTVGDAMIGGGMGGGLSISGSASFVSVGTSGGFAGSMNGGSTLGGHFI